MTLRKPLFITATVAICAIIAAPLYAADKPDKLPDFEADVLPLFTAKCNRCHGAKRRSGQLDMRTVDALLKGGVSGPAIQPGNAQKSLMIEMLHYNEMPPRKEQPRITPDELKILRTWVDGMKP